MRTASEGSRTPNTAAIRQRARLMLGSVAERPRLDRWTITCSWMTLRYEVRPSGPSCSHLSGPTEALLPAKVPAYLSTAGRQPQFCCSFSRVAGRRDLLYPHGAIGEFNPGHPRDEFSGLLRAQVCSHLNVRVASIKRGRERRRNMTARI